MNSPFHILYVDDESALLEIGKLFLERGGHFSVETITSPQEALTLLNSKTYHAVISDYQMPGMDGIDFLKKVRASGNTIPFILFTGRGREEVVIQALNEGADFYLQKGGEPKSQFIELEHQVRQAIQQRRAEANIHDLEQREANIINFLPDPTVVIDTNGVVIAWNHAMEEMTGVPAAEMLGKGDYEYAIPFYGERQPTLIDLVFASDEEISRKYGHITHKKDVLIAETTIPRLRGKPVTLMGIASPLYDRRGNIVGAIESVRDITDRKQADDALKESEKKYRSVIDNIQDMFYRSDRSGNLIMASPSCLRTLGYASFEEILNKPITETFYFSTGKREELLRILTEKGSTDDFEVQLKRSDGTPIWVSTSSHYYRDETGVIAGVEGIFRDITRRRVAEDTLKRDAAQLKEIIDLVPNMIFAKDWNGIYLLANQAVAEGYNTTVTDLVGKSQSQFHGDTAELRHMLDDDREVMSTGKTKFIPEEPYIDAFGKRRFLQTTKVPFTTIGNNQPAVLGVAIDITERKRIEGELLEKNEKLNALYEQIAATEEELRSNFDALIRQEKTLKESEEKYRSTLNAFTDAVSVVDKEFTLILANTSLRSWLLALGWSNDIIGKKIPDAFPFLSPSVLDEYRTVFSTGMMMVTEETSKIGNAEIATETQKIPLKEHGNVVAVIAVIRDITKRKRDWEALRKANRKLNLLSGITRHDIKNQLLSLNGFLEISKKYLGDAAKTSEFIGKEEKILKILERQITFTKEYEAVGVNAPVWQDCRTLVETAATQVLLGIDLVNNDLPAGLEVFADPLIVKVCYNLMDNAVHHGGKITTIRFFMEERDGDHIVVCEDDGIGIPADEKEKIFERGFGKNTGIGLFLAREILSITGITITENGEPGKGARFEMTVPKGAWRFIHP